MPLTPEQKAAFLSGLDEAEAAPAKASQAVDAYKEQGLTAAGLQSQEPEIGKWEDRKNRFVQGVNRNLITQAGDYVSSLSPALSYNVFTGESGEDYYGEGFNDADPALRRQMMHEKRQAELDQYYPINPRDESSWGKPSTWDVSGAIGEMVDPSSLLMFGRGVKGAMGTGAAVGGSQNAIEQLNATGKVDLGQVATSAVISAVGAGAIEKAIVQPVTAFIRSKLARGAKVTAEELREIAEGQPDLKDVNLDSTNFNELADQLNERFGTGQMTPEKAKMLKSLNDEGDEITSYNEATVDYMMGRADKFNQTHSISSKKGELPEETKYAINTEKVLGTGEAKAAGYGAGYTEAGARLEKLLKKRTEKGMSKEMPTGQTYKFKLDEQGNLVDDDGLPAYLDADRLKALKQSIADQVKPTPKEVKTHVGTEASERAMIKANKDVDAGLAIERLQKELPTDEEAFTFIQNIQNAIGTKIDDTIDSITGTNTEKAILAESEQAVGGFSKDSYSVVNFGLGDLTQREVRQRSAGVNPGAAYAAIVKKDLPWTGTVANKISPEIGKLSALDSNDPKILQNLAVKYNNGLNGWLDGIERFTPFGSIEGRLKQAGAWGELTIKAARDHLENAQLMASTRLKDVDVAANKFRITPGSAEDKLALDLSRKVVIPRDVPPHVRAYSQELDKMIDQVGKDAVESGVWTKEEAAKYAANRREKGYIPRIIDYDKLSTSTGRKVFMDQVAKTPMSKEEITSVLKAYLGEKDQHLSDIVRTLPSGKTVIMPKELAQMVWASRSKLMSSYRSKHLEAPRVLPEKWEAILSPFYINDSRAVMANYLKDAYHRIEGAKVWGANDEQFGEIFKKLFRVSPRLARSFEEAYRASVADSNSRIAQSFLEKSDKWQRTSASVRAWQTLKMSFSAINNVWQAPINGLTRALGMTELPVDRRLRVALAGLSGLKNIPKGELRDQFDRSGAAFSTTFTQAMGDYNEAYHSIFGKLPKMLSFAEVVNNPSKFLKAVGQFLSEDINRSIGYNQGKAYLEHLLATAKDLQAQGNRANPAKVKEVNKAIADAGLPVGVDPDKISLELIHNFAKTSAHAYATSVEKMGQRWSNDINFVNSPFKLPFPMQSFWGKILFQFASYDFHQTRFVYENALKPAAKALAGKPGGTLLPLMGYLGVGIPGGMATTVFYSWLMGDDKDLTATKNLLFAATRVAGLGRITTLLQASSSNKFGLASAFLGPSVGDASELAYGAMQTIEKGNAKPGAKALLGITPPFPNKKALLKEQKDDFRESEKSEEKDSMEGESGFFDF